MADVTPNRNYPRHRADGKEPAKQISQTLYDALTAIDLDIKNLYDDDVLDDAAIANLESEVVDLDGRVTSLEGRVDGHDTDIFNIVGILNGHDDDIEELQNTKEDAATRSTVTDMTYDANSNLLFADNGLSIFQNPVYVDNILQSYEQIVNGVTTTVTLSYNINGDVTSIGVS
jgi:hypothetical protein